MLIKTFHGIFSSFSRPKESNNVSNFSVLNRRALTAFLSMQEQNRHLPGLRACIGYRQRGGAYARQARHDGTLPKMSYQRLFALALDALFAFANLPIKTCLYSGLVGRLTFLGAGFLGASIYLVISKLLSAVLFGWSSLGLGICFVSSIRLLFLGILGEYVF